MTKKVSERVSPYGEVMFVAFFLGGGGEGVEGVGKGNTRGVSRVGGFSVSSP